METAVRKGHSIPSACLIFFLAVIVVNPSRCMCVYVNRLFIQHMAEFSIKFISQCSACRENTIPYYIYNGHASEICSLLRRARELWRTKGATATAT